MSAANPSRKKLRQAVAAMRREPARVAMVGERVFTVPAGNRLGMFTISILAIVSADPTVAFSLLRSIEFAIAKLLGVSFTTLK